MQPLSWIRMKFVKAALKSMLPSVSIADEEQSLPTKTTCCYSETAVFDLCFLVMLN